MRIGGILVILLFLLTSCAAAPVLEPEALFEGDRLFSETEDPRLILSDRSPEEVLEILRARYGVIDIDFESEQSLYVTVHTDPVFRLVVVENDLDGPEDYLIMITRH